MNEPNNKERAIINFFSNITKDFSEDTIRQAARHLAVKTNITHAQIRELANIFDLEVYKTPKAKQ